MTEAVRHAVLPLHVMASCYTLLPEFQVASHTPPFFQQDLLILDPSS